MATRPTEALTVIPQYNIEPYDETTNPYGFDAGGHIYNHLQSFQYVVQIENYLTDLAGEIEANATQAADDAEATAADRVVTGQDRAAAANSAAAAAASAAGVNLPAVSVADAGKALKVKMDGSGYEPILIPTPTIPSQAEAEAGTDNTKFMTSLRGAQQIAKLGGRCFSAVAVDGASLSKMVEVGASVTITRPSTGVIRITHNRGVVVPTVSSWLASAAHQRHVISAIENGYIEVSTYGYNNTTLANGYFFVALYV